MARSYGQHINHYHCPLLLLLVLLHLLIVVIMTMNSSFLFPITSLFLWQVTHQLVPLLPVGLSHISHDWTCQQELCSDWSKGMPWTAEKKNAKCCETKINEELFQMISWIFKYSRTVGLCWKYLKMIQLSNPDSSHEDIPVMPVLEYPSILSKRQSIFGCGIPTQTFQIPISFSGFAVRGSRHRKQGRWQKICCLEMKGFRLAHGWREIILRGLHVLLDTFGYFRDLEPNMRKHDKTTQAEELKALAKAHVQWYSWNWSIHHFWPWLHGRA